MKKETLLESLKRSRINEELESFVYGITNSRPRTTNKEVLEQFAMTNVKHWSSQEPSESGYVWKMKVNAQNNYTFVSCTYIE